MDLQKCSDSAVPIVDELRNFLTNQDPKTITLESLLAELGNIKPLINNFATSCGLKIVFPFAPQNSPPPNSPLPPENHNLPPPNNNNLPPPNNDNLPPPNNEFLPPGPPPPQFFDFNGFIDSINIPQCLVSAAFLAVPIAQIVLGSSAKNVSMIISGIQAFVDNLDKFIKKCKK